MHKGVSEVVRERLGTRARLALGSLSLALALVASASAIAASDFGDAPDGKPAGHEAAPGVVGSFPSLAATPGPRHDPDAHGPGAQFFLGGSIDGEADSLQVDADSFDDGVDAALTPCKDSTLELTINGAGLPAATLTSAHTAYVNAWFDWNRDGDWADSADPCRAEWAVENLPVDLATLAPGGIAVLPVGLTAGSNTTDVWARVTLTLDEPVVDPTGRGGAAAYGEGETEDFLLGAGTVGRRICIPTPTQPCKPGGKKGFKVSCVPNPAVIFHGGTAKVKFAVADKGSGLIIGGFGNGPTFGAGKAKFTPVKPQPPRTPKGIKIVDGFTFKSTHKDPPTRIEVVKVKFRFARAGFKQKLTCSIVIVHVDIQIPRILCGGACAGTVQTLSPSTTLSGSWARRPAVPIELVSLSLTSVNPIVLNGFDLPLQRQAPAWPGASLVSSNDPQMTCEVATIDPAGGPAALSCRRPAGAAAVVNSFYRIAAGVSPAQGSPVTGEVMIDGQEFALQAPERPTLGGGGQLASGGPPPVNFTVAFTQPVTALAIVVPSGFPLSNPSVANPPGVTCSVQTTTNPSDTVRCTAPNQFPANAGINGTFNTTSLPASGTAQLFGRQLGSAEDDGPLQLNGP